MERRLARALALSLAIHGLALTPALIPPLMRGKSTAGKNPELKTRLALSAHLADPANPVPTAGMAGSTRHSTRMRPATAALTEKQAPPTAAKPPARTRAPALPPTARPNEMERPAPDPFGLGQYRLALGRAAGRFRAYPVAAREAGWEGRVRLRLDISEAGLPCAPSLSGSSGHALLDQAALELMRQAVEQTPLPDILRGQGFAIDLAVEYRLGD